MKDPVVSVIIPVYNTAQYLPACIDSVLSQTYASLELFLVDDGSTDESLEICQKYAQADARVVVMTKENGGQGTARNMALDRMTGEYILFVDSDDCIQPTMLEDMLSQMHLHNAELGVCSYERHTFTGVTKMGGSGQIQVLDNYGLMRDYVATDHIRTMLCNKLYKARLFSDVRFPEIRANEDAYILHEILGKCEHAVYMDVCYYIQNVRADSTEQKPFSPNNLVLLDCARRLMDYYRANYPDLYGYVAYKEVNDTASLMRRILMTLVYGKHRKLYKKMGMQLKHAYQATYEQFPDKGYMTKNAKEAIQNPIRFWVLNTLRGWKRKLVH